MQEGEEILDVEGLATLESMAQASRFNRWMAEEISSWFKGDKVMEIGSGLGNISQFLLHDSYELFLSDINPAYREFLKQRFANDLEHDQIISLNIEEPDFVEIYSDHQEAYSTLFSLNVIEHIEEDQRALENCFQLLKPGGRIIILVPAFSSLFNHFDEALGHYRRYHAKGLSRKMEKAGFTVQKAFYFNSLGILGWWISGKILRNRVIPESQVKIFDRILPLVKFMDKVFLHQAGLSVIAVGEKLKA